jgi:hypothetical protein
MAKGCPKANKKDVSSKGPQVQKTVTKQKEKDVKGLAEAMKETTMTVAEWTTLQKGMKEKWPQPDYMKVQNDKGHTCYRNETYEVASRFMAETKILYRPHAKRPGTKSHVRYEKYSQGKTVGETFELGSWPADWCWDIERGYIKVLGPLRDEPIDISTLPNDAPPPTEVDRVVCQWYRKELAKKFNLKVEDLFVDRLGGENVITRCHRLVAQREAKKIVAEADEKRRAISDEEIARVLGSWGFARNHTRLNVMQGGVDWVWSDTLGLLRDRVGDIHLTKPTIAYPEVSQVINRWLKDRLPEDMRQFSFTTLNLNKNYAAGIHRDGNNFGPSMISAFGDFGGGALNYYADDDGKTEPKALEKSYGKPPMKLNLKQGVCMFNGNNCHSVDDFQGNRFSVVYFTLGCHANMKQEVREQLQSMDYMTPRPDADPALYLCPPGNFENKAQYKAVATPARSATTKSKPAFMYFEKSALAARASKGTA